MKNSERQKQMFEFISLHREQSVETLAAELNVSVTTVRRDLAAMARRGLIERTWGGANVAVPVVYDAQEFEDDAAKRAIAVAAARHVRPSMVVAISGGSTCTELARLLRGRSIKVLTNAVNIALELRSSGHTQVVLSGGVLNAASYELVGPMVERSLSEFRADIAFTGCSGVLPGFGFSMRDEPEAEAARAITRLTGRVMVLADHRKIGRQTFARFAHFSEVERLITDDALSQSWQAQLAQLGLNVELGVHATRPDGAALNSASPG